MDLEGMTEKRTTMGNLYFENQDGEITAKACGKCGEVKALSDYVRNHKKLGGRSSRCKKCDALYRKENKEHLAYLARKWVEENYEYKLEYNRKWREENREHVSEYERKYREENRERIVNYRESNKELKAEIDRNWQQKNNSRVRLICQRRRARKKSLIDDFTVEQMTDTLEYFGGCALKGSGGDVQWDHAIPLITGHSGTTYGNMVPLSAALNLSKNDSNIFEWFEANRQRFELSQERFDNLIDWLASANAMTVEEYRDYVYWCHANPRTIDELEAQ